MPEAACSHAHVKVLTQAGFCGPKQITHTTHLSLSTSIILP